MSAIAIGIHTTMSAVIVAIIVMAIAIITEATTMTTTVG
jgi:hypothetical protein